MMCQPLNNMNMNPQFMMPSHHNGQFSYTQALFSDNDTTFWLIEKSFINDGHKSKFRTLYGCPKIIEQFCSKTLKCITNVNILREHFVVAVNPK